MKARHLIESRIDSIDESLNSPYPYKWISKRRDSQAVFKTDEGNEYTVLLYGLTDQKYDLSFYPKGIESDSMHRYSRTNRGEPFRVLSTVISIASKFVDEINNQEENLRTVIIFSGTDEKLFNFYERLMPRLAKKFNFKILSMRHNETMLTKDPNYKRQDEISELRPSMSRVEIVSHYVKRYKRIYGPNGERDPYRI